MFLGPPALKVVAARNIVNLSIVLQWDVVDDSFPTTYTVTWTYWFRFHYRVVLRTLSEQSSYTITRLALDTVYTVTVTPSNRCGTGPRYRTVVAFLKGS